MDNVCVRSPVAPRSAQSKIMPRSVKSNCGILFQIELVFICLLLLLMSGYCPQYSRTAVLLHVTFVLFLGVVCHETYVLLFIVIACIDNHSTRGCRCVPDRQRSPLTRAWVSSSGDAIISTCRSRTPRTQCCPG